MSKLNIKQMVHMAVYVGERLEVILESSYDINDENRVKFYDRVDELIFNFENTSWYTGMLNDVNCANYVIIETLREFGNEEGKKDIERRLEEIRDRHEEFPEICGIEE